MSKKYLDLEGDCATLNDSYQIKVWNEEQCRELVVRIRPEFLPTYEAYRFPVQRVDAIRYFILYEYGGIYMDADIRCIRPFGDYFKENKLYFVRDVNVLSPIGFTNFIMASPPKHKFWLTVFDELEKKKSKLAWLSNDFHVLYSTGPGLVESAYSNYMKANPDNDDFVFMPTSEFNPCDMCGTCVDSNAYINHESHAMWSSKFGRFTSAILCSYTYSWIAVGTIILLLVILTLTIWYTVGGANRRTRT